ncbi:MAG: glycosyltransferase family 2 protein [Defluviitaleaceae bacterium]|nr:glycosyltransferase family 2 protein [Defluviitaleaceae bacterium]
MLLSIGMIVKNEEKYLRECLNGLKPIMEQVHSELIIYDTGSTDGTMEIAKEFTDKVFELEWRGDFAWARNHTLDKALGKWYMFVDADEIYQDAQEIIDFFNTGEYKKYSCARILLQNIWGGENMGSARLPRFFKKLKTTRFEGQIHETIKVSRPMKTFDTIVKHYGYDYSGENGEEIKKAKIERNIAPLLKEYEEKPDNPRTIYHILDHYGIVKDFEEYQKVLDHAFTLFKPTDIEPWYHIFQLHQTRLYAHKNEFETLFEHVENYFKENKALYTTAVNMKLLYAKALQIKGEFERSAESYLEAYDLFNKNLEGKINNTIESMCQLQHVSPEDEYVYIDAISANYARAGDFKMAGQWRDKLEPKKQKNIDFVNLFVVGTVHTKRFAGYSKLFYYISSKHEIGSAEYDNAIITMEKTLPDNTAKLAFAEAIANDPAARFRSDDYIHLQKLRTLNAKATNSSESEGLNDELFKELDYFLNSDTEFPQYFADVFVYAIKYGKDTSNFISNMRITNTNDMVVSLVATHKDLKDIFLKYLEVSRWLKKDHPIKSARLMSTIASAIIDIRDRKPIAIDDASQDIINTVNDKVDTSSKDEEKTDLITFESCIRVRHKYLTMVYKDDIYCDENASYLPEQDTFVYFAAKAYTCQDNGDIAGFAQNLRYALRILPHMTDVISQIGNSLKKEIEEAPPTYKEELTNLHEQLAQEIVVFKTAMYNMISSGDTKQAAKLLEAYVRLNPSDPEIEKIQKMIEEK